MSLRVKKKKKRVDLVQGTTKIVFCRSTVKQLVLDDGVYIRANNSRVTARLYISLPLRRVRTRLLLTLQHFFTWKHSADSGSDLFIQKQPEEP